MDGKQVIEHALKFEIQNPFLSIGPIISVVQMNFLLLHSKRYQKWLFSMNHLTLSSYQHQTRGGKVSLNKKIKQKDEAEMNWKMSQARQRQVYREQERERERGQFTYYITGAKTWPLLILGRHRKEEGQKDSVWGVREREMRDVAGRERKTDAQNTNVHRVARPYRCTWTCIAYHIGVLYYYY